MQGKATGDERDGSFGTVRARLLRRVTNLSRRGTGARPIWFPGLPHRDDDPRSFWNYLNHATLRRSAPRCPGRVRWLRRRPRTDASCWVEYARARGAQRLGTPPVRVQSTTSSHARGSSPSACRACHFAARAQRPRAETARRVAARRAFAIEAACSFPKSRGRGGAGGSRWITKPPDWE